MGNKSKRPERIEGGYAALPWRVMDSPAYQGASVAAKALLLEIARQWNGANNGRFHVTHSWLSQRGWPSKSIVEKARAELLARGLLVQTRQGGLFIGPTWYAASWLPISNFVGLDLASHQFYKGAYLLCNLAPTARRKPPEKQKSRPDHRGRTDPTTGAASKPTDPTTGAIKPLLSKSADPTTGDDVLRHSLPFPNCAARGWRFVGSAPADYPKQKFALFPTSPTTERNPQ